VRPEPNPDDALEKGSESSLDPIVSSFIYFWNKSLKTVTRVLNWRFQ
jgi:hypothetical protein